MFCIIKIYMSSQNIFTTRDLLQRYGQGNGYENLINQELQRLAMAAQQPQLIQNQNQNQNINMYTNIEQELADALALRTRAAAMASLANSGMQNARARALLRAQELRSEADRQLALANTIDSSGNDLTPTNNIFGTTDGGLLEDLVPNTGAGGLRDILTLNARTMQHRLAADRHELAIRHLERVQTIQVLSGIHNNVSATVAGLSQLAIGPYLQQIANASDTSTTTTSTVLSDLLKLLGKIATAASTASTTT